MTTLHPDPTEALTERERQILQLVADGWPDREIGRRLHYSRSYTCDMVRRIIAKLYCNNRAHAVAVAVRRGII